MKHATFLLLLVTAFGWAQPKNDVLTRISFGSCSKQDMRQLWPAVVAQHPELWIWLGDNIYGDSPDPQQMRVMYDQQKREAGYQQLLKTCPIIGTWDDHDYGANDGGKYFSHKEENKLELLHFLDVPMRDPVRKHRGVYSSHTYGTGNKKIKVILLDTRWFRDTLIASTLPGRRYEPNPDGDVLGEEQWAWLEDQLKNSDAAIHLIGSSIQFLSNDHGFEKWGNLPRARQRMIDLLVRYKVNLPLLISGDRHIAEISKMEVPGLPYPLYDFTSSGLTHTLSPELKKFPEKNVYRVGKLVAEKNFGMLLIDWSGKSPKITLEIRGENSEVWDKPLTIGDWE